MDYFVKQLFLCALFKTLIPAPVFQPISLPPFNQVLTLILVHFFHPSFNLPTKQPPLPSQEVSEVREEKVEVPREELPCQGKVLLDPTKACPTHTNPYHTILHLTFSNNTNRRHKMLVVPCHAAILSVSGDGATAAAIPRQLTHNSSIRQ